MDKIAKEWRSVFNEVVQRSQEASTLKQASIHGPLKLWTELLTGSVVETCEKLGWVASAKGHKLDLLPIAHSEYLGLDVMGFSQRGKTWRFPSVVVELENSLQDARIAYSLWKVLSVRAELRIVICYRKTSDEASELLRYIGDEVVGAMGVYKRTTLQGTTMVIVGSREESEYFPYGFFKWWLLNENTGKFHLMK